MEDSNKLHAETLKIAKSLIERDPALKDWVTEKFPELKESEDEKMIRIIIKTLQDINKKDDSMMGDILLEDCIAWLEKQGEQKPTWSEEDELVIYNNIVLWLDGKYISETERKQCLEWFNKHRIEFLTQPQQKSGWSEEDEWKRNELLQYLKEKGDYRSTWYSWLKSIKDRVQPQPKQEWSEEDKGNLLDVKCVIDEVWHNQDVREEIGHSCEELESLWHWIDNIWQRVAYPESPSKQTAWNEEDESHIGRILSYLESFKAYNTPHIEPIKKEIDWLKSLKDRVQPQPKQEWSEEDEKTIDEAISLINMLASGYGEKVTEPITFNGVKMINNIKERLGNLHLKPNHWKPSDEQIEALLKLEEMHVLEHEKTQENAHLYMVVKSIREQLLKLRKE